MKSAILALLLALSASAQTGDPPYLIRLIRKFGMPTSEMSSRSYGDARAQVQVLGMSAITGQGESWLVELHGTFGSLEDMDKAFSMLPVSNSSTRPEFPAADEVLSPARTMLAAYRPDWSYQPDQAMRMLPKARYLVATVYRMRPGVEGEFTSLAATRRAGFERYRLEWPYLGYKVISGAPAGTNVFLTPLTSLRAYDQGMTRVPAFAEGFLDIYGRGEANAKDAELSHENLIFRIEPRLSYVSQEFAEGDPEFWGVKPRASEAPSQPPAPR